MAKIEGKGDVLEYRCFSGFSPIPASSTAKAILLGIAVSANIYTVDIRTAFRMLERG